MSGDCEGKLRVIIGVYLQFTVYISGYNDDDFGLMFLPFSRFVKKASPR